MTSFCIHEENEWDRLYVSERRSEIHLIIFNIEDVLKRFFCVTVLLVPLYMNPTGFGDVSTRKTGLGLDLLADRADVIAFEERAFPALLPRGRETSPRIYNYKCLCHYGD